MLRGVLLCEEAEPEEEAAAEEECLLVPLVIVLGRTRARDRLLPDRDSLPSSCHGNNKQHFLGSGGRSMTLTANQLQHPKH